MDESAIELIVGLVILAISISIPLIGIFGGRITEYRHLKSLARREAETSHIIVTQMKSFPTQIAGSGEPTIVHAETVIASDYLKTFLASMRGIFGGEVRSYQKMLDRARRETLLRLIDSAQEQGYNAICNVRLETADVGGGTMTRGKNAIPMAAILGWATAYHAKSME